MAEVKTKLQKWGNSFGIVIPKRAVIEDKLKVGDEIEVVVNKKNERNVLREMFGTHKFSKSTEELLKEVNEELYDI